MFAWGLLWGRGRWDDLPVLFNDFHPAERCRNMKVRLLGSGVHPSHPRLDGGWTIETTAAIVNACALDDGQAASVMAEFGAEKTAANFYAGTQPRKTHAFKTGQRNTAFDDITIGQW